MTVDVESPEEAEVTKLQLPYISMLMSGPVRGKVPVSVRDGLQTLLQNLLVPSMETRSSTAVNARDMIRMIL